MTIDWKNQARTDVWRVEQVDPVNPDIVRGELTNLVSASVTWGYYTDTRGSASIVTLGDDNYIKHSQLRIIHEIPEWGYSHELFTGYVTNAPNNTRQGMKKTTYTVSSPLYALDKDLQAGPFVVGENGMAINAIKALFDICGREYSIDPHSHDYKFSSTKIYPVGDSYLKTLFDITGLAGDRISIDGHGIVTVFPYTEPSMLVPQWILDIEAPDSLVISEDISESSTEFDVPGRIIVSHKDGDNEIVAFADADSTMDSSSKKRGYMLSEIKDVTDLTGGRHQAHALAAQYLGEEQASYREWQVPSLYFPVREGDCVEFIKNGVSHHALAKTVDCDLMDGTMKLTLKEV